MAEKKILKKYWLEQLTTDISIIFNKNLQSEKQKKWYEFAPKSD